MLFRLSKQLVSGTKISMGWFIMEKEIGDTIQKGIININEDGKGQSLKEATSEIIGYTVSIFVPGKRKK